MSEKNLLEKIKQDYKEALKQKDSIKKEMLNYFLSQINYKRIEMQTEPSEEDIISLIKKEIKTREESLEYLMKGGNEDEIEAEKRKIDILSEYLPRMLSEEEIEKIVNDKVNELGVQDIKKNKGDIIKSIMAEYKSVIDGKKLNQIIDNRI